ncbi:MAG: site-2 protease family protein [archaeon]
MDLQVVAAIGFVLFLAIFTYLHRKNIVLQKLVYPLFYMILYKSNFGLGFMDRCAGKYREFVKFAGYCFIGLGVTGMILISYSILALIWNLIKTPSAASGFSFVLPFTHVPGIGYLSFFHWIIAIFFLALIHEFGHGIVARAHGIPIKSSGIAFFSIFLPIIPAAFVEPDEKKLEKQADIVKYSIFAAGPMVNILVGIILLMALPYVRDPTTLGPLENRITEPIGFSFDLTNDTLPAARAGMQNGMVITAFNGEELTDATPFLQEMYYCAEPGDTITLTANGTTYALQTQDVGGRGIVGIQNFRNERRVKPQYNMLKHPYYWTKDLFRWIVLLNIFIGLFNLLPLAIVDGGRIQKTFLERVAGKEKANRLWLFTSFFFLALVLFGLATTYIGNPFSYLK